MVRVKNHRTIFNREAFKARLVKIQADFDRADIRQPMLDLFKEVYQNGFEEIKRRCEAGGYGKPQVAAQTFLTDEIIVHLYQLTTTFIYPEENRTSAERLSLVAIGGYGREDLAPYSDVDLLFLLPYKQTPWGEQVVEYILYMKWRQDLLIDPMGFRWPNLPDCQRSWSSGRSRYCISWNKAGRVWPRARRMLKRWMIWL